MMAAQLGDTDMVRALLRAGAPMDSQDAEGKTALQCCRREMLVRRRQRRESRREGIIVLWAECGEEVGHEGVLAMLIENGARDDGPWCPGYKRKGLFKSTCKECGRGRGDHS